jgi:hypothetical protein
MLGAHTGPKLLIALPPVLLFHFSYRVAGGHTSRGAYPIGFRGSCPIDEDTPYSEYVTAYPLLRKRAKVTMLRKLTCIEVFAPSEVCFL